MSAKIRVVEAAKGVEWAVGQWMNEVKNRPLQNVHRRSLDMTWRQVITYFGGDHIALCGPTHDNLVSEKPHEAKQSHIVAWAVVTDGKINIKSVSETRRGAIINHMVASFGIMIYNWYTDAEIEALWASRIKPNQLCTTVMVQHAPSDVTDLSIAREKRRKE